MFAVNIIDMTGVNSYMSMFAYEHKLLRKERREEKIWESSQRRE